MSGTNSNSPPGPNGAGDPSMEDILASIRRILAEDEPVPDAAAVTAAVGAATNGGASPALKEDVLVLDSSMLAPAPPPEAAPVLTPVEAPVVAPVQAPVPVAPISAEVVPGPEPIMAAAAAVMANGTNGIHALGEGRPLVLRNTLPCFEDAVREALQPVIKQWLDVALPKLVERLVRTEVERVVGGVVQ